MLGMKKYPKSYIAACRARVEANLRAYRREVGQKASKEFENRFFNDQVLLLDYMFVHRLSGIEGKDGNPLNEVRVLCNSILLNGGKLQVERLPGWPRAAGEIGSEFPRISQPGVSKHLRVLREARLVDVTVRAQERIYSIKPEGLAELYEWVAKYQAMWPDTLSALERYLDARGAGEKAKGKKR